MNRPSRPVAQLVGGKPRKTGPARPCASRFVILGRVEEAGAAGLELLAESRSIHVVAHTRKPLLETYASRRADLVRSRVGVGELENLLRNDAPVRTLPRRIVRGIHGAGELPEKGVRGPLLRSHVGGSAVDHEVLAHQVIVGGLDGIWGLHCSGYSGCNKGQNCERGKGE